MKNYFNLFDKISSDDSDDFYLHNFNCKVYMYMYIFTYMCAGGHGT